MLRILSILALVVSIIRLYAAGLLTQGWVIVALLTGLAVMIMGPKVRIAAIAIGGLLLLSRLYGEGDDSMMLGLMGQILAIAIVLFGIWFMLRGSSTKGS